MTKPDHINIESYSYELPAERIARYPLEERDRSKLLLYRNGGIEEILFRNVPELLNANDQLYFNTTRVIQARLLFRKESGALIEIFCLEPINPSDYQLAFSSTEPVEFACMVGNAKKWKEGDLNITSGDITLTASHLGKRKDDHHIRFEWNKPGISFAEILDDLGMTPIPPYLKRDAEPEDVSNYQTVYAKEDGSVAAPTAGLHFTPRILNELERQKVEINNLVLHVGAGTFIPVKEENVMLHEMHAERVFISKSILNSLLKYKRKIAVGTTTTRSLESIYWLGVKAYSDPDFSFTDLLLDQWEYFGLPEGVSLRKALSTLLFKMEEHYIDSFEFQTRLMIVPGYKFRVIDGLFTNFHQPKSTLLLLIAAFTGENWKDIYTYAMENEFRFLSYGDSSLLLRTPGM